MSEPTILDLQLTIDDVAEAYDYYKQMASDDEVFRICFDDGSIIDICDDSRGWDRATYTNKLHTVFAEVINIVFRNDISGLGRIESRFSNGGTLYIYPEHIVDMCYVKWEDSYA